MIILNFFTNLYKFKQKEKDIIAYLKINKDLSKKILTFFRIHIKIF